MKRTITIAALAIAAALSLTACGGSGTTGFDDASADARSYARSYCETEATLAGRPDHGSRFDACLDTAAKARDAK